MSTNNHIYHETWPVVSNALILRFLTKILHQKAHYLVTRASPGPNESKLEFETQLSKATEQCRQIFTAIEKVSSYICGLRRSFWKEMWEDLRSVPPNMRFRLLDNKRIAASKGRSQRALMDLVEPRQSIDTKT